MNSDLNYFKKIQDDKAHVDLLGPDSDDDTQSKTVFNVRSEILVLPKGQSDFDLVAKNVAHFILVCLLIMENIHQLPYAQQLCLTCQSVTMEKLLHKSTGSKCSK